MSGIYKDIIANRFMVPTKEIDHHMTTLATALFDGINKENKEDITDITVGKMQYEVSMPKNSSDYLSDKPGETDERDKKKYLHYNFSHIKGSYLIYAFNQKSDTPGVEPEKKIFVIRINDVTDRVIITHAISQIDILNKLNGHPNSVIYYGARKINSGLYIAIEALEKLYLSNMTDIHKCILCHSYVSIAMTDINYFFNPDASILVQYNKVGDDKISLRYNDCFFMKDIKNNIKIWNYESAIMNSNNYNNNNNNNNGDAVRIHGLKMIGHGELLTWYGKYTDAIKNILMMNKKDGKLNITPRQLYASMMYVLRDDPVCNKFLEYKLLDTQVHYFICKQYIHGFVYNVAKKFVYHYHHMVRGKTILANKTMPIGVGVVIYIGHANMCEKYEDVLKMFFMPTRFIDNFTNKIVSHDNNIPVCNIDNINPYSEYIIHVCLSADDIRDSHMKKCKILDMVNIMLDRIYGTDLKRLVVYTSEKLNDDVLMEYTKYKTRNITIMRE